MSTKIQSADGSIAIHSDGCRPDFLEHLAAHQSFFVRSFAPDNEFLDYSETSLKRLDELVKVRKKTQQFSQAFVEGAIAYCGEVLRAQTGGKWYVQAWFSKVLGKTFYFPGIETPGGQRLDVSNAIEDELERSTDSRLYHRVRMLLPTAEFPVEKWKEHPLGNEMFPPL